VNARGLAVWLHSDPVADLALDRRGRLSLQYRSEVVDRLGHGALCLSVALPVHSRPYRHDAVERWIEGLLPEGETRTVLEQRFAVRRGDSFGLLCALGRDCAGAVAFLDPQETPAVHPEPTPQSEQEVVDALADLPAHPLGANEDVRVSLGGLQAKLLMTRTAAGGWARPTGGAPSTHLFKPDPPGMAGLVASEALALETVRLAGLAAARVELLQIGGRPVLAVERYDRRLVDGVVQRMHQEDGCQTLGLDPAREKYQTSDRPPSYRALTGVLADHAADPLSEWRRLGELMTATVALGNGDAHARNHSVLLQDGVVRLAPAYDLAPTVDFVSGRRAGLWVDGQAMLFAITRGHLTREMTSWGVPATEASALVDTVLERLAVALPAAADLLPTVDVALLERCAARIAALARSAA
jgi:serine/threonine-protein kinase HipA